MNPSVQTVLFDLDGTLLDTAPDLVFALNGILMEQQREPLPFEQVRPWVSFGTIEMIKRGFNLKDADQGVMSSLQKRFLTIYETHLTDQTRFFPHMVEVLDTLDERGIKWGVVTNKSAKFTDPILQKFDLVKRSVCQISGDTLPYCKPHPAPLLHGCQLAESTPQSCIYVGDAIRDIEAGQRAGMRTLIALYGYIGPQDTPSQWGATGMINQPTDLLSWIN